jgi:hypothetical protein
MRPREPAVTATPVHWPSRHAAVLAPLLVLELALSLLIFRADGLEFTVPLFLSGAISTTGCYAVVLKRWPDTRGAWSRYGVCLATAFAGFQISLICFSLLVSVLARINPLPFYLVVLLAANAFFFPAWMLLGSLAYILIRIFIRPPERTRELVRGRRRR